MEGEKSPLVHPHGERRAAWGLGSQWTPACSRGPGLRASGASPPAATPAWISPAGSSQAPIPGSSLPAPMVARRPLPRVTTQLATENTPSCAGCQARLERRVCRSAGGLGLPADATSASFPAGSGGHRGAVTKGTRRPLRLWRLRCGAWHPEARRQTPWRRVPLPLTRTPGALG